MSEGEYIVGIGAIECLMSATAPQWAHEQLIINFTINKLINRVNDKLCVPFATHTHARKQAGRRAARGVHARN